ncbi:cytosolic endo-beta-N-acetylglucosaminidase [Brevipalpus obovatus]|uniref:cytosolic endo-beta-N-acetylglucosaminidase n=1 Tax=Brevipalpus obovatus TaxID=246614 RepID=UPI003D9EBCF5
MFSYVYTGHADGSSIIQELSFSNDHSSLINDIMCSDRECQPLRTLEEVQEWCPEKYKFERPANLQEHKFYHGSNVIVCHDMKGGYQEDRFVDGCSDSSAYRFYHWAYIDTFIYFSHSLMTIPPITWINAAHTNGVPILGTFIVEGDDGKAICETIFSSEKIVNILVEQLTSIATTHGFDGWFINIENPVNELNMPCLVNFLQRLKSDMSSKNPQSIVIWYDSLTIKGKLDWQNELNDENIEFFRKCDGIFLNYGWKDENLEKSAKFAQDRVRDVYVGVDVFGRGCYGGGGFNTSLAIEKIVFHSFSIALFAPGWVHEVMGGENFEKNQIDFWRKLQLPIRHVPKLLPFETNFCQGFGNSLYKDGRKIDPNPWFNLSRCDSQTRNYHFDEVHVAEAFNGGSCLLIRDFDEPILSCCFDLSQTSIDISLTYKVAQDSPQNIPLLVKMRTTDDLENLSENQLHSKRIYPSFQWFAGADTCNGWILAVYQISRFDDFIFLYSIQLDLDQEFKKKDILLGSLKISPWNENRLV